MTRFLQHFGLMSGRVDKAVFGSKMAPIARSAVLSPSVSTLTFALASGQRELRLDLFRGLALWLIYIDHVSPDLLTWLTIRNYGLVTPRKSSFSSRVSRQRWFTVEPRSSPGS